MTKVEESIENSAELHIYTLANTQDLYLHYFTLYPRESFS